MVVKLTQEQADYLETFRGDKREAIYLISRWGFGHFLKNGVGKVYENEEEKPFNIDEKEKMLLAVINGYEVDVPKYTFHTFSDEDGYMALYYTGKYKQLSGNILRAKGVEKNSDEYFSLKSLGFFEEKV